MIATLNRTCEEMKQHIIAAKQESAPVLEEAVTLMERKRETESKQQLLDAFCQHFIISNEDLTLLTSSAEPLDDRFFTILHRVKQVYRDCEILLGYENQRLGVELMEQTTRNLDAGFKKLYNWIQREFKGLDVEDPHLRGSIRRALRVLSERPTLFQNCLDFFADARQNTLAEAFHDALTGSATGSGKAIEFSTHEPLRYVGDMMAWIHSAAVSEKEALEGLFVSDADAISRGLSAGKANEPWARISGRPRRDDVEHDEDESEDGDAVFDGRKALNDLVDRNLAAVCQTLQHRIELAVRSSGDPVLVYKIFNLLDFYRGTFSKLLGEESILDRSITQLQSFTLAHFEEVMAEERTAATADITPHSDLSPPIFLATALNQFADIGRARGAQMTATELERLFAAMLSGVLNACAEAAVQIPDIRRSDIYKLNYLTALRTTLDAVTGPVPVVHVPLEKAGQEIHSLRDQLVQYLATTLLEDSGVSGLLQEIDSHHDPDGRRQWLMGNLDNAAQQLDEFLSSALMDAQDSVKTLLDRGLANHVVTEAVERFCSEFDELEAVLEMVQTTIPTEEGDDLDGPVPALRALYPRTGAEVRALLS